MSDVKQLIGGIILVIVGISFLLGTGGGIMPWLGGLAGLIGAAIVVRVIVRGNLK